MSRGFKVRNYDWCNERYRNRKPRSSNSFQDRWNTIEYHADNDEFELKFYGIKMHRDGSFSVSGVDDHLRQGYQQGWMQRVYMYTGVWLRYPRDRKLHAYVTTGGKFITGDFTVLPDRTIVCKAPLKRWELDKTIEKRKQKQIELLKLASKFTEKESSYYYWSDRLEAERDIFNPEVPLSKRVKWYVNMPQWVYGQPTRNSKFGNIRKGYWVLRPVPKAKQLLA